MFVTREKKQNKETDIRYMYIYKSLIYLSFFSYSSNLDQPCFIIQTVLFFIESIKRCKIIITRLMDLQHLTLKMILRIMIYVSIVCLLLCSFWLWILVIDYIALC